MWARRVEIARRYDAALGGLPQLELPHRDPAHQHAWQLYMLRLRLDRLLIDRAGFVGELKRRNVGASVHFIPLHLHPYYRERYGYAPEDFPVAHREFLREVSLPIYSRMTDADVADVVDAVRAIVDRHAA
jgi:dTDP-4-amino-4,6-dideoxygalactose transaminase